MANLEHNVVALCDVDWRPLEGRVPSVDFLIYDKIDRDHERDVSALLDPIRQALRERGKTVREIRYGAYRPEQFHSLLQSSRAMIFLCEHESQGLAYQEALSCNVPILALNPGECLEPDRSRWGVPRIPASSVPYWDDRCGLTFRDAAQFPAALEAFEDKRRQGHFQPRAYILENLTLEKCAKRFVDILKESYEGKA